MAEHPAAKKARLRAVLREIPVVTTAQLYRMELLPAAEWLNLPQRTRACVTRVTQQGSVHELTFVASDPAVLAQPAQRLMHLAGIGEARLRMGELLPGERFQVVNSTGRSGGPAPDAELLLGEPGCYTDQAVEFDAGYDWARVEQKLRGFADQGYVGVLWATSVHGRLARLDARISELRDGGHLPGLQHLEAGFVDFWTWNRDPYAPRPRLNKVSYL